MAIVSRESSARVREWMRTSAGLIVPLDTFDRLKRNVEREKHTLITGPTGCGKTLLAVEIARHLGRPFEVFHLGAVFDAEAMLNGTTALRDGDTRFQRSRFIEAITRPDCVIVGDEFNRLGSALNGFMSLLDWQGRIAVDLDDGGERVVKRARGVVMLATANIGPEYVHTEPLDAALLNRLRFAYLDFPEEAEERALVEERGVSASDTAWLVRIARAVRKAYGRGDLLGTLTTRSLLEAAEDVRDGVEVEKAILGVVPAFDPLTVAALLALVRATK